MEDPAFAGLARQAGLVRAGEVSARDLVELAPARIDALDPALHAFRVVLAERALAEAGAAPADGAPLRGVPVAVKDDVDVAGEVTAQGTAAAQVERRRPWSGARPSVAAA
jgi:amidase